VGFFAGPIDGDLMSVFHGFEQAVFFNAGPHGDAGQSGS